MFVLSAAHAKYLLRSLDGKSNLSLLDVGAGSGLVTDKLAPLFHEVKFCPSVPLTVTRLLPLSSLQRWRTLSERGAMCVLKMVN